MEGRFVVGRGLAVPGTDLLADVASEEAVAEEWGKCGVLVTAEFDGLVGDTPPCVDDAGGDDGAGRTGVDAAGAGAAAVGNLCHGFRGNFRIDDQFPDKKVAAVTGVDEHAVLADPTESGPACPGPFKDGGRIGECPAVAGGDFRLN